MQIAKQLQELESSYNTDFQQSKQKQYYVAFHFYFPQQLIW